MIYILTSEPFPHGLASTNRIIAYAHGFQHHQQDVSVICFRKTEEKNHVVNTESQGNYRHIPFRYLSGSTIKAKRYLARRLEVAWLNLRLLAFSLFSMKAHSLVIYYSPVNTAAIILRLATWLKRSKFLKEESEHPSVYEHSNNRMSAWLFSLIHYDLFDGLLLMTNQLIQYFKNERHYRKPILHVPMTVDIERFRDDKKPKKNLITFCGELNDEKDGVGLLIEAFAGIAGLYPDYRLSLIGTTRKTGDMLRYSQLVSDLGLSGRVLFHGKISNDKMPRHLMEAAALVLPRPESVQAQHGFPTKLGEYLATGNPVIVTAVGEIPEYLKDSVNAFIAEPGDVKSLAAKLRVLLENTDIAEEIGKNGKDVAMKYFNNRNQALDIINFYKNLTSCVE